MTALSAEKAALKIYATMELYKSGEITKLKALNEIDLLVSNYFEAEKPIPYTLTEKYANG